MIDYLQVATKSVFICFCILTVMSLKLLDNKIVIILYCYSILQKSFDHVSICVRFGCLG